MWDCDLIYALTDDMVGKIGVMVFAGLDAGEQVLDDVPFTLEGLHEVGIVPVGCTNVGKDVYMHALQ